MERPTCATPPTDRATPPGRHRLRRIHLVRLRKMARPTCATPSTAQVVEVAVAVAVAAIRRTHPRRTHRTHRRHTLRTRVVAARRTLQAVVVAVTQAPLATQ